MSYRVTGVLLRVKLNWVVMEDLPILTQNLNQKKEKSQLCEDLGQREEHF